METEKINSEAENPEDIMKDINLEIAKLEEEAKIKEVSEKDLINEIADLAEGNRALAEKNRGSRGLDDMIAQEEQESAKIISREENEILTVEEKVNETEEKIKGLTNFSKDELEKVNKSLEILKTNIAAKRENLKAMRQAEKEKLGKLTETINSHRKDQKEAAWSPVNYAIDNVISAHHIAKEELDHEQGEMNLDKKALKTKVEEELAIRKEINGAFASIAPKEAEFTKHNQTFENINSKFTAIKRQSEKGLEDIAKDASSQKFTEELDAKLAEYEKEANKWSLSKSKKQEKLKSIEGFFKDKAQDMMADVDAIWNTWRGFYLSNIDTRGTENAEGEPTLGTIQTHSLEIFGYRKAQDQEGGKNQEKLAAVEKFNDKVKVLRTNHENLTKESANFSQHLWDDCEDVKKIIKEAISKKMPVINRK